MSIRVPKGACGAYIETLSAYPKQREFLLDKCCAYKVISVENNAVELEVLI